MASSRGGVAKGAFPEFPESYDRIRQVSSGESAVCSSVDPGNEPTQPAMANTPHPAKYARREGPSLPVGAIMTLQRTIGNITLVCAEYRYFRNKRHTPKRMQNSSVSTVWFPFERTLYARNRHDNPYTDVTVIATFEHESGYVHEQRGFWNGSDEWVIRFSPPKPGRWTWNTRSEPTDEGLSEAGEFEVGTSRQANPIIQHGFLEIADDGRHLRHDDGTPFFWLADTVWAAGAKATADEWERYLRFRAEQGFSVAQFNALPQQDASKPHNRLPFGEEWDYSTPNLAYFEQLDQMFALAHQFGLVCAPVALWFNYVPESHDDFEGVPRRPLTPTEAEWYGQYMAARYGAYAPAWVFGEIDYTEPAVPVYDAVIEAIRANSTHPLCIGHLRGSWTMPEEATEWTDIYYYQTGHITDSAEEAVKASTAHRDLDPIRPVINGEPPYEFHHYFDGETRASRRAVRQAAWVSILSGATAGITYGGHGLWMWHRSGEHFTSDGRNMPVPWDEALHFAGAEDYALLKEIIEEIDFWKFEPCQEFIESDDILVRAARLPEDDLIVIYVPDRRAVTFAEENVTEKSWSWVNPRNGQEVPAHRENADETTIAAPPWSGDGLLVGR